jgi:hypothetical protein
MPYAKHLSQLERKLQPLAASATCTRSTRNFPHFSFTTVMIETSVDQRPTKVKLKPT